MSLRRAAAFICLGALLVAALFPIVVAVPVAGGYALPVRIAPRPFVDGATSVTPPLLTIVTPRHLARASLPSSGR